MTPPAESDIVNNMHAIVMGLRKEAHQAKTLLTQAHPTAAMAGIANIVSSPLNCTPCLSSNFATA